jgi:hypothetical protein
MYASISAFGSRLPSRHNSLSRTFLDKLRPKNDMHRLVIEHKAPNNCRQIRGQSNSSWTSALRERFGEYRRNGVPEIIFGTIIFALVGIDYILQTQNDQQRNDMYKQLEREVRRDEATSRKEGRRMLEDGVASMSKFKCIVRKVPLNFDGHKCLKKVKVGDVVSVIEEGVGPGGQYNLCSIERMASNGAVEASDRGVSIGWFPCSCLEKI